jgi:diguanylate cyclase (GGDEF)-like protein/PAS domain S-box-containing protein
MERATLGPSGRRPLPGVVGIVVLAATYYGVARLGLAQGHLAGNVTPVWPPTGLALVALLLYGRRLWPGVALGALAVNGLGGDVPITVACGMAVGNTLEAVAGAALLRRVGFRIQLDRLRDVVMLAGLAAGLSTALSATIGVASLHLGGIVPWGEILGTWRVWWLGDAMGNLILAPAIFTLVAGNRRGVASRGEAALVALGVLLATAAGFATGANRPYLVFPVVAWAALRFGQRGAATVTVGVAAFAGALTARNSGPFVDPDTVQSLWLLDGFLAVVALTGQALAAVVAERDRVSNDLRIARDTLEARVRDQTAILLADRERLDEAQRIANVGSWEWAPDAAEPAWSAQMFRIHGVPAQAHPPASLDAYLGCVCPDDRRSLVAALDRCLEGESVGPVEYRIVRPGGDVRWLSGQAERPAPRADGALALRGTCQDVTARRGTEEALRESEERFRLSFENAPIGMALVAPDGRWLKVNRSLCHIVGYPPERLLARTFQDITHPDDLDADLDLARRTLDAEIPGYSLEKRYFHADGRTVWINLSVSLVRNKDGQPAYFIAQIEDISARKASELALQHSYDLLDRSQALGLTGSWERDPSAGGSVSWSAGMHRLHGVDPESFVVSPESITDLVHPDDREDFERRFEAAERGGDLAGFIYRTRRPDGLVRWIWIQGGVAADRPGLVIGFAQDITARRQADERFRALLESAPDGMIIVDADGLILLVNAQAESLFGYSREKLLGQALEILLPERLRSAHREYRAEFGADPEARPMGSEIELLARRADGSEFPVEVSLSPLRTEQGVIVTAAVRDITARKQAEERLAHQALHDALTGLPNRVLLNDRLELALARASRAGTDVAVLFVDLDRFKLINDTRGHVIGDQVLVALAERLRAVVRPTDTVARFGGDEFVVICENTMATWEATMLGERIAEVLRRPFDVAGEEIFLSVSVGIAVADTGTAALTGASSAGSLLRDADAAMYRAKDLGRGVVEFFDESIRTKAVERLRTLNALHRATERQELRVFYQPVVELSSGELVGAEALVRWLHPDRGLIGPSEFIPIAEETGLIVPIGTWVLEEAARQWVRWGSAFPRRRPFTMAVNLSARQLHQPDLLGVVRETLSAQGMIPSSLSLELTESVLMDDLELSPRTLQCLRDLGVRLAIDDFGTGYSSLTYLKRFPVDTIKIDQHFVAGLGHDAFDTAIVGSTVEMAHSLGLRVVAEGVETLEQLESLQAAGCDLAQGAYFAMPQGATEFESLLRPGGFEGLRDSVSPGR